MARPIRETPILYGEDAERFMEHMRRVDAGEFRETEERKAERLAHYEFMINCFEGGRWSL